MNKDYRADVDGLRAVAVMPVVLFHAGVPWFDGGFVGVDIFFVISGYLITSIIAAEIEAGRFTLADFYERRIRRIFPALFAVMAFSYALAWPVLNTDEFRDFSQSLVAATLFSANVLFWMESGYFDSAAEEKPLLHTWSLGVEEQFYIFFPPLLLLVLHVLRGRWVYYTAAVAAISFVLSVVVTRYEPNLAFYMIFTRAWELMAGALLALGALPACRPRWLREVLGAAGLGLIVWSVTGFDDNMRFPGAWAAVPVLGATLLIYIGQGASTASSLLSLRPLVFIGLISYSLYLWHWPFIVFGRFYNLGELTPLQTLLVIAASIAAAVLSWRYVERPFRRRKALAKRPGLFAAAAGIMVGAIGLGITGHVTNGLPDRLPARALALAEVAEHGNPRREECFMLSAEAVRDGSLCRVGVDSDAPISFIVWGDSHANALMPGVDRLARELGISGLYAPYGACAPLLGVQRLDKRGSQACPAFNDAVRDIIRDNEHIRTVILVGRWGRYTTEDTHIVARDMIDGRAGDQTREAFQRGLRRTLRFINNQGRDAYIATQVPEVPFNAPSHLAREVVLDRRVTERLDADTHRATQRSARDFFDRLSAADLARQVHLDSRLCADGFCRIKEGESLYYKDSTHLSKVGAYHVAAALAPIFDNRHTAQTAVVDN